MTPIPTERLEEILRGTEGVTPGPWRVEGSIYEHMGAEIVAERGLAQLWQGPNVVADARLMASAPDLLASLKACVGYLLNAKIDLETGASKATAIRTIEGGIKQARAALAKAEVSP